MKNRILKISEIIKLNKIIDSLGFVDLNVYEAYELYKFNDETKRVYSFIEENTDENNFESICENYISFQLPDIEAINIIQNSENKPSNEEAEFLIKIFSI